MTKLRPRAFAGAALAGLLVACTLGDPSVYDRGDLGAGSELGPVGGSSASSSSSTGGSAADAAADAPTGDAAPDAPSVACTDFTVADGVWIWDGPELHYYLENVAFGAEAGVLRYGVTVGASTHAELAGFHSGNCPHCVSVDLPAGRYLFQRSGTSDASNTPCAGMNATVQNLVLEEITYDGSGNSVPVAGGACFKATAPVHVVSSGDGTCQ